jgi:hypothetical protein
MTLARITICLVVIIIAVPALHVNSSPARLRTEADLYRVKKIFLETQTNGDLSEMGMIEFRHLHPLFKEALSRYGFTLVDNPADADAVMYGGNTIGWVVLDGPPLDPPRYGFQFWLSCPKYKFTWLTEFNLNTRADEPERDRMAVEKAAHNLFSAWKKSAARAGIVVRDRLP